MKSISTLYNINNYNNNINNVNKTNVSFKGVNLSTADTFINNALKEAETPLAKNVSNLLNNSINTINQWLNTQGKKVTIEKLLGKEVLELNIPKIGGNGCSSTLRVTAEKSPITLFDVPEINRPGTLSSTTGYEGVVPRHVENELNRLFNDDYDYQKRMIDSIYAKLNNPDENGSTLIDHADKATRILENRKNNPLRQRQVVMKQDKEINPVESATIKLNDIITTDEKTFLAKYLPEFQKHELLRSTYQEPSIFNNAPIDGIIKHYTIIPDIKHGNLRFLSDNSEITLEELGTLITNYKTCLDSFGKKQITINFVDHSNGTTIAKHLKKELRNPDFTKGTPGIIVDKEGPLKQALEQVLSSFGVN